MSDDPDFESDTPPIRHEASMNEFLFFYSWERSTPQERRLLWSKELARRNAVDRGDESPETYARIRAMQ